MSHLGFLLYRVHIYYLLTRNFPHTTHRWLFRTHLYHSNKKFPSHSRRFFSFSLALPKVFVTLSLALLNLLILLKLPILLILAYSPHTTCVSPSHITHIAHICTHPLCACVCVFVRLTRILIRNYLDSALAPRPIISLNSLNSLTNYHCHNYAPPVTT